MAGRCKVCGKQLVRKRFGGKLEAASAFARRQTCGERCMAKMQDARPSKSTKSSVSHYHAAKAVAPGRCARCGAANARDVHHKDGNHANNSPGNLTRLCRSCHVKARKHDH